MPATATSGDEACCWICLEEGNDDHGKPLTRNCACRGDSGWAHVACLARFAKVKTDGMSTVEYRKTIPDYKSTAWSRCHTCKQEYRGGVATSLAKEWVDSVAGLDDISPQRIAAMLNFAETVGIDSAIQTCEDLRGILHSNMQDIDHIIWFHAEDVCLQVLTQAHTASGNKEKALEYAEKFKSFNIERGCANPDEVEDTAKMLTNQLATCPDQGADAIRILTDVYDRSVRSYGGKDSPAAIKSASEVAKAMFSARKFKESYHWYKDAHDRAKRVFGQENPWYIDTKRVYLYLSSTFGPRLGTLVLNDSKLNGKETTILRTTKDGKKYIVELGSETGLAEKVKVTPSQLVFAVDTPVTMDRFGDCPVYIDSFDKKSNSYKIFAMGGIKCDAACAYLDVPRKDVVVIFPSQCKSTVLLSQLGK